MFVKFNIIYLEVHSDNWGNRILSHISENMGVYCMHQSAMKSARLFFDTYGNEFTTATVVDVGAMDINGSIRNVCPANFHYIGVDLAEGEGVDVVLDDPYQFPFAAESADIAVCSSVLEHTELFWLSFLEILRILKPLGLFYFSAPSNGWFHRHPVDCWRFYPDSAIALVHWAHRNAFNPVLLESFIAPQDGDIYNDFVSVILKDKNYLGRYPSRMVERITTCSNAIVYGKDGLINHQDATEDMLKLAGFNHSRTGSSPNTSCHPGAKVSFHRHGALSTSVKK